MKVKALEDLLHDELGPITKGQEFEATEAQLSGIKRFVEPYKTKVTHDEPETPKPAKKTGKSSK